MLKNSFWTKIALNSALGLVLIFVWSRFVDLSSILQVLWNADFRIVIPFFLIFLLSGLIRATRLKLLLSDYKISLKDLFLLNTVSQFLSFIIPLRVGELTKSVYLSSQYSLAFGKTVVWILVDRFLDFWVDLVLIAILLPLSSASLAPTVFRTILALIVIFTLLSIVAVVSQNLAKKMIDLSLKYLPGGKIQTKIKMATYSIVEGLGILKRRPLELLGLIFLTVLATLSDTLLWVLVFFSLGIKIGIFQLIFGDCLSALSYIIPAAPGYVGSAEAAGLAVFGGVLGLPVTQISAATILNHALSIVALPLFGILALYFLKFDLGIVWKKFRK